MGAWTLTRPFHAISTQEPIVVTVDQEKPPMAERPAAPRAPPFALHYSPPSVCRPGQAQFGRRPDAVPPVHGRLFWAAGTLRLISGHARARAHRPFGDKAKSDCMSRVSGRQETGRQAGRVYIPSNQGGNPAPSCWGGIPSDLGSKAHMPTWVFSGCLVLRARKRMGVR